MCEADASAATLAVKRDVAEAMAEQAVVERELNRLFAYGHDDVGLVDLLRALAHTHSGDEMDTGAVEAALVALEAANKIMYRDSRIYLI